MTRTTRKALASALRSRATRTALIAVAFALLAALLAACSSTTAEKPAATAPEATATAQATVYPLSITDDAGRSVTIEAEPRRVVSLAPGNTEILYALGLGDRVVGVTTYDDYPAQVAEVEKVGDFAGPNMEAVAAAEPDLVLVTTGVQADVIEQLEALGATVVAIDPQSVSQLFDDIRTIGSIAGVPSVAEELVTSMQSEISVIQQAVASFMPVTAFVEIGQAPLYTVGQDTLIGELVELAGGTNVVEETGYVPYSVEQLIESDPAVYLATKSSAVDADAVSKRAGFAGLSAVKAGSVVILDDNPVSRPGPRIVEGLRQIAEGLHPEAFEK